MKNRIEARNHRAVDYALSGVFVIAVTLTAGCGKKETAQEQSPPRELASITLADTTFKTPESVLYVSGPDVYLVSNINGSPGEKDNNGFISRVAPDGRILEGAWIAGGANGAFLDAPKGMAVTGDTLLVADIDAVRLFHLTSGAPLGSWEVPGATFLNDMTSAPDGTIYVTDSGFTASFDESGTDALYRFGPGGEAIAVVKDPSLGHPNGICVAPDGVVVVTFGSGDVYRVDPASGARTDLPKPPTGQLDGVVRLADGTLLISSWEGSKVYRLDGAGTYTVVVEGITSPADIGYDSQRGRLLIPVFMENRVEIRELP